MLAESTYKCQLSKMAVGLGTVGVNAKEPFHEVSCGLFSRSTPSQGSLRVAEKKQATRSPNTEACKSVAETAGTSGVRTHHIHGTAERSHSLLPCHCGAGRTRGRYVHPQVDQVGRRVTQGQ